MVPSATLFRFRSVALLAVASLTLAACGSGGSGESSADKAAREKREADIAAREAAVKKKEEQLAAERDADLKTREATVSAREAAVSAKEKQQAVTASQQAAKAKQQADKEKELQPSQFAGFNYLENVQLSTRINEAVFNESEQYILGTTTDVAKVAHHATSIHSGGVKFINLTPEIDGSNIDYTLKVHRSGSSTKNSGFQPADSNKEFEITKTDYTAANLNLGLGNRFTAKTIKADVDDYSNAREDGKFYAEIATDFATGNTTDYSSWGFWFKVPKQTGNSKFYDLAAFARPNTPHGLPTTTTGTATYTGGLLGLHTLEKNGKIELKRLTGVASITANFGTTSDFGSLEATFNGFKLDGQSVTGKITFSDTLPSTVSSWYFRRGSATATIDGVAYDRNSYTLGFAGPSGAQPTGIIGTLKGGSTSSNGNRGFVAAFATKKTTQ